MRREIDLDVMGKDYALCTFSQRLLELVDCLLVRMEPQGSDYSDVSYQWYNLSWLCDQAMRQLFVVLDQVADIYVAVIVLQKRILAKLVSVLGI